MKTGDNRDKENGNKWKYRRGHDVNIEKQEIIQIKKTGKSGHIEGVTMLK